ncbi:hypothetical protein [Paeniglutamicibacter terrestris]|uniref:hypothetical protein n=1 Tax=Paeniglutamicibacter terrestris TaxID=2723403 RepID=UPI001FD9B9FF|nr:hypothetical protein [Paeniglutamicibacter terrestris]
MGISANWCKVVPCFAFAPSPVPDGVAEAVNAGEVLFDGSTVVGVSSAPVLGTGSAMVGAGSVDGASDQITRGSAVGASDQMTGAATAGGSTPVPAHDVSARPNASTMADSAPRVPILLRGIWVFLAPAVADTGLSLLLTGDTVAVPV